MRGYKSFRNIDGSLVTQADTKMDIGVTYEEKGPIKWNHKGFHFCTNIEDTFRYMNQYTDKIVIAEVEGTGDILIHDDDYNGNYDMRVSSKIRVLRVLSREEVLKKVLQAGEIAICKMIQSSRLTQDEINMFSNRSIHIDKMLRYYQMGDTEAFQRKYRRK